MTKISFAYDRTHVAPELMTLARIAPNRLSDLKGQYDETELLKALFCAADEMGFDVEKTFSAAITEYFTDCMLDNYVEDLIADMEAKLDA